MRHIDLCQSNPLKQAKQILYNFYHQSLDQINNPVELTRLYSQTCNQLDKIIPTNIRITRQVSTQLPNYSNILVVANHINTTYLTQLTSPKLIQQLNIQHDPLHSPGLLPIIFRQYPIDNFLSQYHLSARFINGLPPKILAQLSYAWGSIHVPGLGDNRTQIVIDQIESTLNPKDALVIFPEGKNTAKKYFKTRYYFAPFRKGFAVIANKFNLPILPISIGFNLQQYSYEMKIHPIIPIEQIHKLTITDLISITHQTIYRGLKECLPKYKILLTDK